MAACLIVDNLSKSYGTLTVFQNWNVDIKEGERVVILGPSGSGKTTFLRLIAGLESPDGGLITNHHHKTGFVFQEPRLIPWRSVKQNLLLVNEQGSYQDILNRLSLSGFEDYYPAQLSGGMKQRVNLARAMITNPDLLILDEAFSSLDLSVKTSIMTDINKLWEEEQFTIIAVTHDLKEAIFMADRILILSGRPSRIIKEITVKIPCQRKFSDPGFLQLESELIDAMYMIDNGVTQYLADK